MESLCLDSSIWKRRGFKQVEEWAVDKACDEVSMGVRAGLATDSHVTACKLLTSSES